MVSSAVPHRRLASLPNGEPERRGGALALAAAGPALRLAARAWKLAELGLADIVQRRHGYEDYAYILVARRRPRRAASAILPMLLAEAA